MCERVLNAWFSLPFCLRPSAIEHRPRGHSMFCESVLVYCSLFKLLSRSSCSLIQSFSPTHASGRPSRLCVPLFQVSYQASGRDTHISYRSHPGVLPRPTRTEVRPQEATCYLFSDTTPTPLPYIFLLAAISSTASTRGSWLRALPSAYLCTATSCSTAAAWTRPGTTRSARSTRASRSCLCLAARQRRSTRTQVGGDVMH